MVKELRIDQRDFMEFKDHVAAEFVFKQRLRQAGFDMSKPIEVFDDFVNLQRVYRQEEETDERDKRKGRIKMELQRLRSYLAR